MSKVGRVYFTEFKELFHRPEKAVVNGGIEGSIRAFLLAASDVKIRERCHLSQCHVSVTLEDRF